ncbi:MAG: hypothetical protein CL417_05015 [Acidimicrobiaceae bacterium]|nr:hypothetical protein [Acidimicrobiaceae bacterium]
MNNKSDSFEHFELISAYLDGEVTQEERAFIEENPDLVKEVEKLKEIQKITSSPIPIDPLLQEKHLAKALSSLPEGGKVIPFIQQKMVQRGTLLAVAAAAVVFLLIPVIDSQNNESSNESDLATGFIESSTSSTKAAPSQNTQELEDVRVEPESDKDVGTITKAPENAQASQNSVSEADTGSDSFTSEDENQVSEEESVGAVEEGESEAAEEETLEAAEDEIVEVAEDEIVEVAEDEIVEVAEDEIVEVAEDENTDPEGEEVACLALDICPDVEGPADTERLTTSDNAALAVIPIIFEHEIDTLNSLIETAKVIWETDADIFSSPLEPNQIENFFSENTDFLTCWIEESFFDTSIRTPLFLQQIIINGSPSVVLISEDLQSDLNPILSVYQVDSSCLLFFEGPISSEIPSE